MHSRGPTSCLCGLVFLQGNPFFHFYVFSCALAGNQMNQIGGAQLQASGWVSVTKKGSISMLKEIKVTKWKKKEHSKGSVGKKSFRSKKEIKGNSKFSELVWMGPPSFLHIIISCYKWKLPPHYSLVLKVPTKPEFQCMYVSLAVIWAHSLVKACTGTSLQVLDWNHFCGQAIDSISGPREWRLWEDSALMEPSRYDAQDLFLGTIGPKLDQW